MGVGVTVVVCRKSMYVYRDISKYLIYGCPATRECINLRPGITMISWAKGSLTSRTVTVQTAHPSTDMPVGH